MNEVYCFLPLFCDAKLPTEKAGTGCPRQQGAGQQPSAARSGLLSEYQLFSSFLLNNFGLYVYYLTSPPNTPGRRRWGASGLSQYTDTDQHAKHTAEWPSLGDALGLPSSALPSLTGIGKAQPRLNTTVQLPLPQAGIAKRGPSSYLPPSKTFVPLSPSGSGLDLRAKLELGNDTSLLASWYLKPFLTTDHLPQE